MPERIALIGAGVIGKRHLNAVAKVESVELVAVADPLSSAAEIATEHGVPHYPSASEMLGEVAPSGVITATPTEHHFQPALASLDAGCHLLIEKPIAATVAEAEEIARASEARGLCVLVGHHRRYYPQVAQAREMVRGGSLGQLVTVSGQWSVRKPESYYTPDWRRRSPAGPVLTNLIHEVDYLRYVVGEIRSVTGLTGNSVQGFEKEDAAAFAFQFENGALGAFVMSDQADSPWAWEMAIGENPAFPRNGQNCITFSGTRGALEFPNLRHWTSDGEPASWITPKTARDISLELGDAFVRQIKHFAEVVAGHANPVVSAADATGTLGVTLAVLESARCGNRIDICGPERIN